MGWDSIEEAQYSVDRALDAHKQLHNDKKKPEGHDMTVMQHEVTESLCEAKSYLAHLKNERSSLYSQIEGLSESLKMRGAVVKHLDAYYLTDESGNPTSDPFCLKCWESQNRLLHLIRSSGGHKCTVCGFDYLVETTPFGVN